MTTPSAPSTTLGPTTAPPKPQPTLRTARLVLRPFVADDAEALTLICNDLGIVRWTSSHPFPYERRNAEEYLASIGPDTLAGKRASFAVTFEGALIGGAGLRIDRDHQRAELGYLIGRAHWGSGFASEGAARVVQFGFQDLGLVRIHAGVFNGNPASMRVLEKLGMRPEGLQRRHVLRLGAWHDLHLYGLLREEWDGAS